MNRNLLHLVVFIFSIAYFYSSPNKKKQKFLYILLSAVLIVLSCLRSVEVGIDTQTYATFFLRTSKMSLSESLKWNTFEPGYVIINKAISYFTTNIQIFLSVMSIFILAPILFVIWKHSENPILSILVFVAVGNWYSSFAALRQWCAISVMVWSYGFIIKRKFVPFLIVVLLGYTMHQSALFILPLYFAYSLNFDRTKLLLAIALSFGCFLFQKQIMSLLNIFARLDTEEKSGSGYIQLLTFWMLVFIIEFFATPIEKRKDTKINYIALIYSAIIQPICLKYGPFARIHLYCWFGMTLGIPNLVHYMGNNYDRQNTFVFKLIVTGVLIAWFLVTVDEKKLFLIF